MKYEFASIPTVYKGIQCRSIHEARYLAFFGLYNIEYEYESVNLPGWIVDVLLNIDLGSQVYTILGEIKPWDDINDFSDTVAFNLNGELDCNKLPCHGIGLFGRNPSVSRIRWHYDLYGLHVRANNLTQFCKDWETAWIQAGNIVQWKPSRSA